MKRASLPLAFLLLSLASPAFASNPEAATLLQEIRTAAVDRAAAVAVQDLTLPLGPATLRLERGTVFPATRVAGRVVEVVFLGQGQLEVEPPDEVEAGQLELFTGRARLAEPFEEAVLAIADEETMRRLLAPASGAQPAGGDQAGRAAEVFTSWRESAERRGLGVEGALFADGYDDPSYRSFLAGWFDGAGLGLFTYSIDPTTPEPVSLAQFLPWDAREKDKRRAARIIRREQREGRLVGLRVEDLGIWDTWMSAPLTPGVQEDRAFEPRLYTLDVTLAEQAPHLTGKARIDLRAVAGGRRTVKLQIHNDLTVRRLLDSQGRDLPFLQSGSTVTAQLPEAPAAGQESALSLEYSGNFLEGGQFDIYALRDPTGWYPSFGPLLRAPFDVTLRWPRHLDLVASGRRLDGGDGPQGRWERRLLDVPSIGFSFEVGKFRTETFQVGHVQVTVALERHSARLSEERAAVVKAAVQDSLAFFELAFGPYPLDYMTVVNVPRGYSQGLPGFVTLSAGVLNFEQGIAIYQPLWRKTNDPRAIVAHEVSHQWWGNLVGWKSYRDQWISEALANYSTLLYGRARLGWKDGHDGTLIENWRFDLTEPSPLDGRPMDAAGPLILGWRLDSSHGDLYDLLTYKKGGVVVETLARAIEPRKLYDVLRSLAERYKGQKISTRELLDFVKAETRTDLSWLERRLVYGTGLPEIEYRYDVEPRGEAWTVRVQARQRSPYRFRYRLIERPGGGLDVARELVEVFDASRSALSVPVQIVAPGEEEPVQGRVLVRGRESEFTLELARKPADVWLDREGVVYGSFFKEGRQPKEDLFRQGLAEEAAGRTDAAVETLRRALAADLKTREDRKDIPGEVYKWTERSIDARIHLELARLLLDAWRTDEARQALQAADQAVPGFYRTLENHRSPLLYPNRRWLTEQFAILESRLDLRTGKPEKAFSRLRDPLLGDDAFLEHTEAYLLLAVAARATGRTEDYEEALEVIRARGVETGPLHEERAAK